LHWQGNEFENSGIYILNAYQSYVFSKGCTGGLGGRGKHNKDFKNPVA